MSSFVPMPTDVRDYAKSLGWIVLPEALADRLYVFNHPDKMYRQLMVPMDRSAPDYAEAVQRAMEKLAELQGLSVAHVIAAVQSARADTLRHRVTTRRYNDDTLPLSFAASFLQGAQQMWMAAACTVLKPQAHHPRLHRVEAQELVANARFGHTGQGSFVLQVSCPIHALDTQVPFPFDNGRLPFVRATTLTIKRALETLVDAVEADTLDRLVERIKSEVQPILSANFCDALGRFHDDAMQNDVDVSFAWAVNTPLPKEDRARSVVRVQSDYFARIEEVRRELRASESHHEDTFIGTVERLDGEMGEDGRRSGDVIVSLLMREGESVRARMTLTPEQYAEADKVHMTDGAYVKVAGRLHPGRQPRLLSDIRIFEQLPR